MRCYLDSNKKSDCFGCEACVQICPKNALCMQEDGEGFRYPQADSRLCVDCGLCRQVCPAEHMPERPDFKKIAFGGRHKDGRVLEGSTSGGAFTAVAEAWCDENTLVFGAEAEGLEVFHSFSAGTGELEKFRKSKYSQSRTGNAYSQVRRFLREGKKVLFSGTPCQIAGLLSFLGKTGREKLLTVEVACEGVPSPLFVRKLSDHLKEKYGAGIKSLDYRFKDKNKWDFQVMQLELENGKKLKKDRWLNPFWSIWLSHLMSRPSCYGCPFAVPERIADISLGDLWGVHLYCPELYFGNKGASLMVANTEKGAKVMEQAEKYMEGHGLDFAQALKYQGAMRRPISEAPGRAEFMEDLKTLSYTALCRKWAVKPDLKLLYSKYVWGNRQKVFVWNLRKKFKEKLG